MNRCTLCPRRCLADRARGERGFCGAGGTVRVARAAPHFWEEPCLVGPGGSGTVFFSGCNLRCVFCQNRDIRGDDAFGIAISVERLAEIFGELAARGVSNINLVTPTPWLTQIRAALRLAWENGLYLPVVYNSSGYESVSSLVTLRGDIRIYLPDFKYWNPSLAASLSGAADYPEAARAALAEMVKQCGPPRFDSDGLMTRGVIVRHLVLPGQTEDSMQILDYLHRTYGDDIVISIMSQYTPMPGMTGALARPLTEEEYRRVVDFARTIGITRAYLQEGGAAAESFIPLFDGEGVLP